MNSISVGTTVVDEPTFITLDITPSARYSTGGYIEVIVPTNYNTWETPTGCFSFAGLTGS